MSGTTELQARFGAIDIYLFDQLLKGRITPDDRILDAGCGSGRNAHYLLAEKFHVWGVDHNPRAVGAFAELAAELDHPVSAERAQVSELDRLPFPDHTFDVVICSAVLHFATGHAHFQAMVAELWRVLRPGGLFFARLASSEGIRDQIRDLGDGRAILPDGSERYLTTERELMTITARHGALLDPLKTTIVHGQRAMTTWVGRKGGESGI